MSVAVFDLRGEPCELAVWRWAPHKRRDPARLRGVVLHSWATEVGTSPEMRRRYGEPEALARRALAAPYFASGGLTRAGLGVVALAHPVERYTYASDAGNGGWLAVAAMGAFPFVESGRRLLHTPMSDALAEVIAEMLAHAVKHLAEATGHDGPFPLITHRQCINGMGDHAACPGEAVVRAALRSQAVVDGALMHDPDLVLVPEWGRAWPAEWRTGIG